MQLIRFGNLVLRADTERLTIEYRVTGSSASFGRIYHPKHIKI